MSNMINPAFERKCKCLIIFVKFSFNNVFICRDEIMKKMKRLFFFIKIKFVKILKKIYWFEKQLLKIS